METTLSLMSPEGTHGSVGGSVGEVSGAFVCGFLVESVGTKSPYCPLRVLSLLLPPILQLLTQGSMKFVSHLCICNPPLEKSRIRKFPLGPNLCHFWWLCMGFRVTQANSSILYNASRLTLFFSSGVLNFSTGNRKTKLSHPPVTGSKTLFSRNSKLQ